MLSNLFNYYRLFREKIILKLENLGLESFNKTLKLKH